MSNICLSICMPVVQFHESRWHIFDMNLQGWDRSRKCWVATDVSVTSSECTLRNIFMRKLQNSSTIKSGMNTFYSKIYGNSLQWRHNGRHNVSNRQPTIVFTNVYLDTHQRKHQSSASLAFVWGIHWRPVKSPHKWPVTRKTFSFDDVIMYLLCYP